MTQDVYVKVNRRQLNSTANEVDNYVSLMKQKMTEAENEVNNTLLSAWSGLDASVFKKQWEKVKEEDSAYKKMLKALEIYAEELRYAEKQYRDAQIDAINRATGLPRW